MEKIELTQDDFFELEEGLKGMLKKYGLEPDAYEYNVRLNRERNFLTKIVSEFNRKIKSDDVILWDIDGTLGFPNFHGMTTAGVDFEIRPAVPILFKKIREVFPVLVFGIITSKSGEHLEKALTDQNEEYNFVSIANYFDPEWCFSSRDYNPDSFEEAYPYDFSLIQRRRSEFVTNGDYKKHLMVISLKKKTQRNIIPIDDRPYTTMHETFGIFIRPGVEDYQSVFDQLSCDYVPTSRRIDPNKEKQIAVLLTGGTIDSYYNGMVDTVVPFDESVIPKFMCSLKSYLTLGFQRICMKDSRELTDEDRGAMLEAIKKTNSENIIIAHGTYTMPETARYLAKKIFVDRDRDNNDKKIILVGSLIPLVGFAETDAGFNLGFACAKFSVLEPGVYIAMNGKIFNADEAEKNIKEGKFTSIFSGK